MGVTLERALYRLLHHASFRAAWRRGEDLGLTAEDADALSTLDATELERAARLVIADVLTRRYRGIGGLREMYPRSLPAEADGLVARFLESDPGEQWGASATLEDAFGRFLRGQPGVDVDVVDDERCVAVARGLLVDPPTGRRIPPDFRACATGWYTVRQTASGHRLYAAVGGRLVQGPISAAIAGWLAEGTAPAGPAREAMARLGLVAS